MESIGTPAKRIRRRKMTLTEFIKLAAEHLTPSELKILKDLVHKIKVRKVKN